MKLALDVIFGILFLMIFVFAAIAFYAFSRRFK